MTAGFAAGCSDRLSPEDEVRAVIAAAEVGAEARDVSAVMELVADDYEDPRGQSKDDVRNLVRGFFVLNQSVHLLVRVEDVQFPADGLAQARVVVGMLGRQSQESWDFAADVYTFDVRLVNQDGEWRVHRADWQRGTR